MDFNPFDGEMSFDPFDGESAKFGKKMWSGFEGFGSSAFNFSSKYGGKLWN
jgi:hypothetical protein